MPSIETRVQDESDYNRAMLRHMYGGALWIAPQDVRTLGHVFLEPHTQGYVPFRVTPDDLPPMHNLTAGAQEHLNTHLRSRLAQLGATSRNVRLDLSPSTLNN